MIVAGDGEGAGGDPVVADRIVKLTAGERPTSGGEPSGDEQSAIGKQGRHMKSSRRTEGGGGTPERCGGIIKLATREMRVGRAQSRHGEHFAAGQERVAEKLERAAARLPVPVHWPVAG